MEWIRNLDKLEDKECPEYITEYEFASDSYIPGVLDYKNGKILCGALTFNKDSRGLYKYSFKIKFAGQNVTHLNANQKGYLFKGGIPGELISIFSLYFQARFFVLAAYSGEQNSNGLKTKTEFEPLYRSCYPYFNPNYFSDGKRNFAIGLSDFLDMLIRIDTKYHQALILAFYQYSKALREFGIDEEMVFIRLVSAIEATTKWIKLNNEEDLLKAKKFDEIINTELLSEDEKIELKKIFDNRKAFRKFKKFIEYYSRGFFKGGFKAPLTRIKKDDLLETLNAIYTSRSAYLHDGEVMYLSHPMRGSERWDTDPTVGWIIGNRKFEKKQKLPYSEFFQRLVRYCLIKFIQNISQKH